MSDIISIYFLCMFLCLVIWYSTHIIIVEIRTFWFDLMNKPYTTLYRNTHGLERKLDEVLQALQEEKLSKFLTDEKILLYLDSSRKIMKELSYNNKECNKLIICSLKGHSFYDLNEKNDIFDKIKECSLCNLIFAYKKIDTTHANYTIYKFDNNDHLKDVLLEKNEDNMKEYRHGFEFKDGTEFFIEDYMKEIIEHIKNKQGYHEEEE